jgi:hypothetical protein
LLALLLILLAGVLMGPTPSRLARMRVPGDRFTVLLVAMLASVRLLK